MRVRPTDGDRGAQGDKCNADHPSDRSLAVGKYTARLVSATWALAVTVTLVGLPLLRQLVPYRLRRPPPKRHYNGCTLFLHGSLQGGRSRQNGGQPPAARALSVNTTNSLPS